MTQRELDHNSRTQMKGETQTALRDCLREVDQLNTQFYSRIYEQFPELGKLKALNIDDDKPHECGAECNHLKRVEDYRPPQTDVIIARFRAKFGDAKTSKLLDIAEEFRRAIMLENSPSNIGAMSLAYSRTIPSAYDWAHTKIRNTKIPAALRNQVQMPAFPLVINYGGEFEREIWREGYTLVSSKITQNLLPEAMETISSGLTVGQTWGQIASQLSYRYEGAHSHWIRLVRSEMAQAAHRSAISQYETVPQLKGKWSTSKFGATCEVCMALDGRIFKMDSVPPLPHPNCRCVITPTFAG